MGLVSTQKTITTSCPLFRGCPLFREGTTIIVVISMRRVYNVSENDNIMMLLNLETC